MKENANNIERHDDFLRELVMKENANNIIYNQKSFSIVRYCSTVPYCRNLNLSPCGDPDTYSTLRRIYCMD